MHLGIVEAVAFQRSPGCGHTEHDRAAAVTGVILEESQQLQTLGQRVPAVVTETESPDRDDGFAVVVQVGRILSDPHPIDQQLPIVHHATHLAAAQTGQIVHDGVSPAVQIGSLAAVVQHDVDMSQALGMGHVHDEALNEHAIDTAVLHPLEMAENRFAVEGAENLSRPTVGMPERGGEAFVLVELGHVRPEVDLTSPGLKPVARCPVHPPPTGAVALGGEPALIATHHLAKERATIDARMADAAERPHGPLDDLSKIHGLGIAPVLSDSRRRPTQWGVRLGIGRTRPGAGQPETGRQTHRAQDPGRWWILDGTIPQVSPLNREDSTANSAEPGH